MNPHRPLCSMRHCVNKNVRVSCMQELIEKLENKSAKIGIVGLGYVGLPLTNVTHSNWNQKYESMENKK